MNNVKGYYDPDTGAAYVDIKGNRMAAEILYHENHVAAMFGVTVYTVRYWRREKLIDFILINRTVRFSQSQIDAFIQRHSIPAEREMTPTKAAV